MPHPNCKLDRNLKIIEKAKAGLTLEQIGEQYGVTRERIRQICQRSGIDRNQRGAQIRKLATQQHRISRRQVVRDFRAMNRYGCTYAELIALNGRPQTKAKGCLAMAYINQLRAAEWRGIEFDMTFPQWVKVWIDSGRLQERGRGHGKYVMSRFGDKGAYRIGNVFIQLADDNNSEGMQRSLREKRFPWQKPRQVANDDTSTNQKAA